MQHGFEQAAAVGSGGGELGLQLVADGHQLIDLGDDTALFGEGWDGYIHPAKRLTIYIRLPCTSQKKGERKNSATRRLYKNEGSFSKATLKSMLNGSTRSLIVTMPVVAPSLIYKMSPFSGLRRE